MQYVKLTKIEELLDALHPNNTPVGAVCYGVFTEVPVLGHRFRILPISHNYPFRGLSTSGVQEIIDDTTFKTWSSIYKWELFDELPADIKIGPHK